MVVVFSSLRSGSWFISELCQTLCEFSTVMDLDEIQKKVNAEVVQKYAYPGEKKTGVSHMPGHNTGLGQK